MELIGNSWDSVLCDEYGKPYFTSLTAKVAEEYEKNRVYPPRAQIYSAFAAVPYEDVKVVILGQDPYHGEGQAF